MALPTEAEQDAELKNQIRANMDAERANQAAAAAPPPQRELTQEEKDTQINEEIRENMKKQAAAPADSEDRKPTQEEKDAAMKSQITADLNAVNAAPAQTQEERDAELKQQVRANLNNQRAAQEEQQITEEGAANRNSSARAATTRTANDEKAGALQSAGAVGAVHVRTRAVGHLPAWSRPQQAARTNAAPAASQDSNVPPEMRSSLPPELRAAIPIEVEESSEVPPELRGINTSVDDGGTSGLDFFEGETAVVTVAPSEAPREEGPKTQTRLFLYLFAAVIVIGAVVAVVIVVSSGSDATSGEPLATSPPTNQAPSNEETACPGFETVPGNLTTDVAVEYNFLLDSFIPEVLPGFDVGSVTSEPCSPTNLALHWMAKDIVEARKQGKLEAPSIQRFVLVFLYISWNGDQWTLITNSWLQHDAWVKENSAKPDAVECEWDFVTCDGDVVTGLNLASNGISGSIPTEIGLLDLVSLSFLDNYIFGTVPSELGLLSNLEILGLEVNRLTGTFPFMELTAAKNLRTLALSVNFFSGELSTSIGQWAGLEFFDLYRSGIVGTIPSEVGLTQLVVFNAQWTGLSGQIPSELGKLSRLEYLNLAENQLTGVLFSEIGLLSEIRLINLWLNPNLQGSLPTELGNLAKLDHLILAETSVSGTIPTELGLCTALSAFVVTNAPALSGPLPSELGALSNLSWLELARCALSGTIPDELLSLDVLDVFNLQGNDLVGPLPSSASGVAFACLNVAGNELEGPFPALYCNVTEPTFIIVECGGVLEADCGCCNCTSTSSDPALWYEGQAVPCTFLRADFDFLDQYNVSDIFFDY